MFAFCGKVGGKQKLNSDWVHTPGELGRLQWALAMFSVGTRHPREFLGLKTHYMRIWGWAWRGWCCNVISLETTWNFGVIRPTALGLLGRRGGFRGAEMEKSLSWDSIAALASSVVTGSGIQNSQKGNYRPGLKLLLRTWKLAPVMKPRVRAFENGYQNLTFFLTSVHNWDRVRPTIIPHVYHWIIGNGVGPALNLAKNLTGFRTVRIGYSARASDEHFSADMLMDLLSLLVGGRGTGSLLRLFDCSNISTLKRFLWHCKPTA